MRRLGRTDLGLLALAACASAPPASLPESVDARLLAALRASVPSNAIGLGEDPYRTWAGRAPPVPSPGSVCGVRFEQDGTHYRMETFPTAAEAGKVGYHVSHAGACGVCSTLQDLAVYLERPDLTTPVRRCGMEPRTLRCLEALGFSDGCARIWDYNVQNTRRQCFAVCMRSWMAAEPPTRPDGGLNDCLQCDEDESGPVFKAVAGRTRRNSGIRSSIPRPADELAPVVHDYVPIRE